jgi:hypothetical protein
MIYETVAYGASKVNYSRSILKILDEKFRADSNGAIPILDIVTAMIIIL